MSLAAPEQIWFDSCYYYYDAAGKCMPKYVLVLAVDVASGDSVTRVLGCP